MDTNKLLTEAKARFKHAESKLYLEEKYVNRLIIASQGGMWSITPEFLGFLKTAPEEVILRDIYNTPVKVNSDELLVAAQTLYDAIMLDWLTEFTELQSNR